MRNALSEEAQTRCVMRGEGVETTLHLVLHCEVARKVWLKLMTWLKVFFTNPSNLYPLGVVEWVAAKEEDP